MTVPAAARLLFLPGDGGDPAFWKPVADRIRHPGDKVLLGWPPPGPPGSPRRIGSLDDIYALIEAQIDRPVALIAQSMGGVLAMRAALDFPRRVRSLVLAATSGGLDIARFGAADWRPGWRRERAGEPWWADGRSDLEDRLAEIEARTLLLWGDADPISPVAVGRHLAATLRRAELVVVPGGDHALARDRAADIAPHIERHLAGEA